MQCLKQERDFLLEMEKEGKKEKKKDHFASMAVVKQILVMTRKCTATTF